MEFSEMGGTILAMALYLLPVISTGFFVWLGRLIHYRRDRRNPLTKDMLRAPGHTLAKELDAAKKDLLIYLSTVTPIPLFLVASWSLQISVFGAAYSSFPWIFTAVFFFGAIYLGYRITNLIKCIRQLSLGLEAETAVGQELNQLLRDGFEVFHDLNIDGRFNIDHVVVGRSGVYAIETKGRAKPLRDGKADYKVKFDGEQLVFPGWIEIEPVNQAKRNAEFLSHWLTSATGEVTEARPVLMLPGWWIDRTVRTQVILMNATNCRSAFPKLIAKPVSEEQLRRVIHQLDAQCRDVERRKIS